MTTEDIRRRSEDLYRAVIATPTEKNLQVVVESALTKAFNEGVEAAENEYDESLSRRAERGAGNLDFNKLLLPTKEE